MNVRKILMFPGEISVKKCDVHPKKLRFSGTPGLSVASSHFLGNEPMETLNLQHSMSVLFFYVYQYIFEP